ncbi:hypothetical protein [uncultured Azohydromonas sp.]|jgi:hypothetical protein|uniref:hypothetical protein n=1 Tax=uncultured Azohydromonas sp. TaxID=487342 RepID=UPI002608B543|nr:hypothetical protein [uncultured Azohydromonas sp.]
MGRKWVSVACVLAVAACTPQNPPEAKAAEEAEPASAIEVPAWAPLEFDFDAPTAQGVDLSHFFSMLQDKMKHFEKDEYETSAEFATRTANSGELIAPISLDAAYLFFPQMSNMEYDADRQVYARAHPIHCTSEYPFKEGYACEFASLLRDTSEYDGTNAFGAKARVRSEERKDLYFLFPKKALSGPRFRSKLGDPRLPFECPVPLEDARALRGRAIRLGYVMSVREPKVIEGEPYYSSATIRYPVESRARRFGIPGTLVGLVCATSDAVIYSEKLKP